MNYFVYRRARLYLPMVILPLLFYAYLSAFAQNGPDLEICREGEPLLPPKYRCGDEYVVAAGQTLQLRASYDGDGDWSSGAENRTGSANWSCDPNCNSWLDGARFTGNSAGAYNVTAQSGENDSVVIQVISGTFTVSGYVYWDLNTAVCCGGVKDPGESGVAGETVSLAIEGSSGAYATAVTDPSGFYSISGVPTGYYRVSHIVPRIYSRTTDDSLPIEVKNNIVHDFGVYSAIPILSPSQQSSPEPQAINCTLSSAVWVAPGGQINTNESVALIVYGQGCNRLSVSFDIYEWDPAKNDFLRTVPATFLNNVAQSCYTFTNDDFVNGGNEIVGENLIFDAKVFDESGRQIDTVRSPEIVFLNNPRTGTGCSGSDGLAPSNPGLDQIIKWGITNPLRGMRETQNVFDLVIIITDWILNIAGSLIVILIIYSGVRFLISRGNPGEIQRAKSILFWAIAGFGVVLIGKGFIYLIESVLRGQTPIF